MFPAALFGIIDPMTLAAKLIRPIRALFGFFSEAACGILGDAVAAPPPPIQVWGKIAALCLALAMLFGFGFIAQDAVAHTPEEQQPCPDGKHRASANYTGDCEFNQIVELYDFCQSRGFPLAGGDSSAVFRGETYIPCDAGERAAECQAGGFDVFGGNCQLRGGNAVSGCASVSGAEYVFASDRHYCRCPQGRLSDGQICLSEQQCRDNKRVVLGDQCVTRARKCEAAEGWRLGSDKDTCSGALMRDAGSETSASQRCYYSDEPPNDFVKISCMDAFGANLDFPPFSGLPFYHFNCDPEGTRGLIPATANTIMAANSNCACADPKNIHLGREKISLILLGVQIYLPGYCYPEFGEWESFSDSDLCDAYGGNRAGRLCAGIDKADTFCILDGPDFDCRGLLRHVRTCNELDRLALNPFLCGARCESGEVARGGACQSGN